MPYITPPSLPSGVKCRQIEIPNNDACNAAVVGAIYELTRAYNWEQRDGETVEDTVALFQTMFDSFSLLPECSPGGSVDYQLQDDITLVADATSYTLTDLDLLSGRDLRIEISGASATSGRRHLRVRVNSLTTSIYAYNMHQWRNSVFYYTGTTTSFEMRDCLPLKTTPQNYFGYMVIDIPNWKDTDKYPLLTALWNGDGRQGRGHAYVKAVTDVQSMTLFSSSGDLLAGTKIAVYTRG